MLGFDFSTSDRIIFGNGTLSRIASIAPDFGSRAIIICGSGSVSLENLFQFLHDAGVSSEIFRVGNEPDHSLIMDGHETAKAAKSEFVIAFGGGSVLDTGKAIAALMTNPGELMDYLEVIGLGKEIPNAAAPMIAVPTTAGTGTEVTRNAVISSPEHHVKVSMRSRKMIPQLAIVDPELTYSMPPAVTASTGMDALTQVIEAYVSNRANPMTDILAREGIRRGARSLLRAYQDGDDKDAREDMAMTSLLGGLALANGGLGAVHGFAGPIGGMFNAPHGVICASLLPHVMNFNVAALTERAGTGGIRSRYEEVAILLTGDPAANIEDGVSWIEQLAAALEIPGLHKIGIKKEDFDQIIQQSKISSSMQKNPVKLDEDILEAILMAAY